MKLTVRRKAAVGTLVAYTTLGGSVAKAAPAQAPGGARDAKAAPQAQQPVRRFDIAGGSLAEALHAYSAATGVAVSLPGSIDGFQASAVSGVFTAEQALRHLLSGTGITYSFTAVDAVQLELRVRETVEVTARVTTVQSPKYTEPLRDIPQTITVVSAAVIQEQNATTLREVLRNVPGITMQAGEGGVPAGDQMSIRGFSARTDMFVDGVRDFGGYFRDPYNVDQVEVTKGPSSSVAGRGSTGGSINMASKAPQLQTLRSGTLGVGSGAYKRGTLDLNQPVNVGVAGTALRLNAMWTDTGVPGRDAVESSRWGVSPSLSFGLGTPTRFTLAYSHLGQDNVPDYGMPWVNATSGPLLPYSGGAPPVDFDNFYGILDRDFERTNTDLATATIERDFGRRLTLRDQLRYGRNSRDSVITAPRFVDVNSPTLYSTVDRQLQSRDMTDTIASNQLAATARFDTGRLGHALATGLELSREGSGNWARLGPVAPVANLFEPNPDDPYTGTIARTGAVNDGTADTVSVYAFETLHVGSKLELTGGVRFDHFEVRYDQTAVTGVVTPFARTDDIWSWRAGAVYKPCPNGSVYAGAGTSFNPSAEGLSLAANNVKLDPEQTTAYELGTKWDVAGGRLSLASALFRTEKSNARTPGVNPGDPPLVLSGKQIVNGVEMGVAGTLRQGITLFAGYAHMNSEIEESNTSAEVGNALTQTPEDTFNLWLSARLPSRITLGGGVQYMDTVYRNTLNTLSVPSYWVVNGTAAVEVSRRLTLRLNGTNLADSDYVDRVGGGHFIPGPGRSLALTADVKF